MNEYEKQAEDFMSRHKITMKAVSLGLRQHFPDDKYRRYVSRVTLKKPGGFRFTMTFGHSLVDTFESIPCGRGELDYTRPKKWQAPSAYDVLSCLEKSEPAEDLREFMQELGIDRIDDKTSVYDTFVQARTTHKACRIQWLKMARFFTAEEIEELQDIQ